MMELIIRLGFIVIIFLFYFAGVLLTKKIEGTIDFKTILPVFSLVFWDYYFKLFSNYLFRLEILSKKALDTDGKIHTLLTKVNFYYNGNREIKFRVIEVKVRKYHIYPILIDDNNNEIAPEGFGYSIKNNSYNSLIFKILLRQTPIPLIILFNRKYYILFLKIKYAINDLERNKRVIIINNIKR